jgi:uncharacterized membrane protein YczE
VTRRLVSLYAGLALFGAGVALLVRANLGLDPWDVLHQGLARQLGVSLGAVVIGVSGLVMLAWIPLRERPGLGTLSNVVLVGLVIDLVSARLHQPDPWLGRAAFLAAGIMAIAVATALYIGAGFGPGPRDGLMTGLARRGHSIRAVRTGIEVAVLVVGWLLGGTVGIGTLAYAVSIGPLVQLCMGFRRPSAPARPGGRPSRSSRRRARAAAGPWRRGRS